ncbi:MAG: putative bifunctional diguanylate cyclase/phosphodiesterase [Oceanicaulis sp.]
MANVAPADQAGKPVACADDMRAAYERLTAMQALVAEILGSFVQRSNDEVDAGIDDAIARLGAFCGADRTYVFQDRPSGLTDNTHEWCAPGIAPEIDNLQNLPHDAIEGWVEPLAAGRPIHIPSVGDLPEDRADERAFLQSQGIQSVLVVPMLNSGKRLGIVGFDAVHSRRVYTDGEISLLRSVTDVIASSLVRRNASHQVELAQARLCAITRHSKDLVVVIDAAGFVQWASHAATEALGSHLAGSLYWKHVEAKTRDKVLRVVNALKKEPENPASGSDNSPEAAELPDHVLMTCNGPRWISARITDLRHDDAVGGLVITAHDITERRSSQDALAYRATHDILTGLPNRALLIERIRQSGARALRNRRGVGIVFLDIDHFKLVNDGHSHSIGDRLLIAVARRLQETIRPQDTAARFGGDEFVVVVDQVESFVMLETLANEILERLCEPVTIDDREFQISASVGITMHQGRAADPEALIQQADMAMYTAKAAGRARIIAFDQRIREEVERRTLIAHQLYRAVEQGHVQPAFQPIIDLRTRRLKGYEALARWTDDVLGPVSPAEFIPVAEELGIIRRLGECILERALAHVSQLGGDWRVSVNLSPLQFEEPDLINKIDAALANSGLAPNRLCLEITESAIIKQPDKAIQVMEELGALGIRLAIDDFGTGYSSLSMLRKLPVHVLKIDRSFISEITRSHADLQLVRAIIGLANDFGLDVTAEGIESEEQAELLTSLGCTNGQGYLFGRPECAPDAWQAASAPRRAVR